MSRTRLRTTPLSDWWKATTEARHEQGDLIRRLPIVKVEDIELGDEPTLRAGVETIDAIVVTQTCDLQNAKIRNVLLARVLTWTDFAAAQDAAGNTAVRSRGFRRGLIRGDIPPLTLLHEQTSPPVLRWSVVDFRELHTIQLDRLDALVLRSGHRRRLRLQSPYKEHFAQAFARFYMRVGPPHDAAAFEDAGQLVIDALARAPAGEA